jgi:predicted Zn-dependent protease
MRRAGAFLLFSLLAAPAAEAAPVSKGTVLVALEQGVARSFRLLVEKGDPPPYFLSYHVSESEETQLSASRGAVRRSASSRSRVLDIDVRVGSYDLDSSRRLRGARPGQERLRPVFLPLEDDVDALLAGLWLETDRRYRTAVERFQQVKADVAVKTAAEDSSADFSRESPTKLVAPLPATGVLPAGSEEKLRSLSILLARESAVLDSEAALTVTTTRKSFASSEGAAVQHGHVAWRLTLYATTRADDGMDLYRFESFTARTPEGLPDEETLRKKVESMTADLVALRAAPVLEPFTGPAILSGRAAGVFFHEIFGHRIEGHRQKDEGEGQTFTKMVGQRVLPEFLSIYDDPTRATSGGTDLNGSYLVDDEGVAARRATVVEKGVLKGFLMSRTPVAGFATSNGHGRAQAGQRPVGRQANLIVEAAETVSETRLREMLVEECRKQGRPFGLLFADISGGFTFTGRFMPQSFKVSPILVYRVYADGRPDELVRGADLIGTPLVAFSRILAAGSDREVFNGNCGAESGWVPVSASSPSILTAQIEVQKKEKSSERPPLLPPPGREVKP